MSPIPSIAIDKERTDIERLEMTSSMVYHLQRYAEINRPFISIGTPDSRLGSKVTAIRSSLETRVLPKFRSFESILQPINRLPRDVLVLIPHFFTEEAEVSDTGYNDFSMNAPLITMTHVCRSWRNALLSTTSLWKKINFSVSKSQQAEGFLRRSGNQPLDIFHYLEDQDRVEPFLSATLHNVSRLRRLKIGSSFPLPRWIVEKFLNTSTRAEAS